ncbi:MAG TPA: heme lyase CcmF/NrfE family subunit [Rhizomicrobium sp.]|jgi:cytochrome c-type biogenesis protein CcmF|nr:heme lyase CcmF/NrfE family subunit [Rhizomicrobium sp.]
MTGEIGLLALCFALALACITTIAGLAGARAENVLARSVASSSAIGLLVFVALSFGALTYASIVSDFSILNVAQNSHTLKPLIYKISGVWGNHEGSMLLWVLVLAIYSAAIAWSRRGSERLTSAALGVQGLLAAAFILFILFTSNPFVRLDPAPFEGDGLNPLLQDFGLAVHPPMLYIGYVGLSAAFAYAAAALITRERDWARAARPFMLAAWIALTLGIALGSWWAYYELGWGGFWFWDPVENASLMPWLIATALLHSALATERTGAFRSWTLLLAIAGFSLSLIGTFLVRSGVLSSVHAFASDPTRGLYILVLIFGAIGGALALFAWRAPSLEDGTSFEPVSRETALLLNNVFLTAAAATIFVGTLYPLILDSLTGTKISVGPPYYAATFAPIFFALLLLVPLGPRLAWKRGDGLGALRILAPGLGIALIAGIAILAFTSPRSLAGAGAFAVAGWLAFASVIDIYRRGLRVLPASAVASSLAHFGLAVTLIGVAGVTLWRSEALEVLAPGESMYVGTYQLRLDGVVGASGPNYQAARANISVLKSGETIAVMHPERRIFPAERQETVETAIRTTILSDLYLALGDQREAGRWTVRAYVNPLAPLIWLGAVVMALGGFASLWGRLRKPRAVPDAATVAAE